MSNSIVKCCYRCKQEKPLSTKHFARNRNTKDGFSGRCKACDKVKRQASKGKAKSALLMNMKSGDPLNYQEEAQIDALCYEAISLLAAAFGGDYRAVDKHLFNMQTTLFKAAGSDKSKRQKFQKLAMTQCLDTDWLKVFTGAETSRQLINLTTFQPAQFDRAKRVS